MTPTPPDARLHAKGPGASLHVKGIALHPAALRIALRPAIDADAAFLQRLYGETRSDELAFVPWTDVAKAAFLASQFALQHRHFTTPGVTTDFWIVEIGGEAAGRLYVRRDASLWRLVEISLRSAAQGRGAGSALIDWLQGCARDDGASGIDLHVLVTNPRAASLYARHGFVPVAGDGHGTPDTHRRMIWRIS